MIRDQLIFLGAPGSGKGTQAYRLVKEHGLSHVSTGDLLRDEIKKDTPLGQKVKGIIDGGNLVDDLTVLELLQANCDLEAKRYIFDGFPRNAEQSRLLEDHIIQGRPAKAIYFETDLEELTQRIVNRRVAPGSGEIYNLLTKPPKIEGKCDVSGEELVHRHDDNEEVVKRRMEVFNESLGPILDFYSTKNQLFKVDASQSSDQVFNAIRNIIAD